MKVKSRSSDVRNGPAVNGHSGLNNPPTRSLHHSFSIPSGQGTPPFGHAARRGEGERKGPSISRHTRLIAGGGPDGAEWDGMRRVVDGERAYGEIARRQNDDGTAETVGSLSLRSFMSRVSFCSPPHSSPHPLLFGLGPLCSPHRFARGWSE